MQIFFLSVGYNAYIGSDLPAGTATLDIEDALGVVRETVGVNFNVDFSLAVSAAITADISCLVQNQALLTARNFDPHTKYRAVPFPLSEGEHLLYSVVHLVDGVPQFRVIVKGHVGAPGVIPLGSTVSSVVDGLPTRTVTAPVLSHTTSAAREVFLLGS